MTPREAAEILSNTDPSKLAAAINYAIFFLDLAAQLPDGEAERVLRTIERHKAETR